MFAAEHGGGVRERVARDIDADVARRLIERAEQALRFDACATARLDHTRGDTDVGSDLRQALVEKTQLDPRRIVVVEARDLIEQLGSALVVEQAAREPL